MKIKPKIVIREAVDSDIDGIVTMDLSVFGDILEQQTTDPHTMFRNRLRNCHGWFWVLEIDGAIEGFLSAQPMQLDPETFISWADTTTDGTFEGTYDNSSTSLYVAALSATPGASKIDATDLLLAHGMSKAIREGKKRAYFISRMPGYHKLADVMTAEEYYQSRIERKGKKVAMDWQLRMYESFGAKRVRLVKDGYDVDWQSAGYGVLFVLNIPFVGWPFKKFWALLPKLITENTFLFKIVSNL